MKNVLMIAWYFPPIGGPGTQRTSKYCKYLPSYGWSPFVIGGVDPDEHQDATLLEDIPADLEVHRIGRPNTVWRRMRNWLFNNHLGLLGNQIGYWLDFPDTMRGWVEKVVYLASIGHHERSFGMIYTTSSPYSSHFAGSRLKVKLGLPWVADLRDPWSDNLLFEHLPPWMKKRHRSAERRILGKADAVIVVNEGMRQKLIDAGVIRPEKCHIITNGFDPDDYEAGIKPAKKPTGKVLIVHTGSFYFGYTPERLFEALENNQKALPTILKRLCIRFVGGVGHCSTPDVPYPKIEVLERVPLPDAISHQKAGDILLIIHDRRIGMDAGYLPGKFFGYLAARKPILAAVPPEGYLAQKVREWNLGWVANPDNPEEIIKCLAKAVAEVDKTYKLPSDRHSVYQYSRIELARKLATIFDSLVGNIPFQRMCL